MQYSISPATGVPIYQQLIDQIAAGIARGQLRPNQRLPSVRELSQTLVVNPNTVARAYTELEREGVLYTRQGLGVFVAEAPQPVAKRARRERLLKLIDPLLVEAVRLGCTAEELIELIAERTRQFAWTEATTTS
ncbi:MAG TPA: GntR family transcriptional regulator [Pirellulales bacterium]|nr:GntR family transcriptional regulator [Pirellulales bacterium]